MSLQRSDASRGILSLPVLQLLTQGHGAQISAALLAFIVSLFNLFASLLDHVNKKDLHAVSYSSDNMPDRTLEPVLVEQFPVPPDCEFPKADFSTTVRWRLGEVERKVVMLQPKSLPTEKENNA